MLCTWCDLCNVLRWAPCRPGTCTFLGLSARCATQALDRAGGIQFSRSSLEKQKTRSLEKSQAYAHTLALPQNFGHSAPSVYGKIEIEQMAR